MKKRLVALGMAFLMAMSTCMTAFAGYWYLEDGRWEYRDDSGARVRDTLKKSGSQPLLVAGTRWIFKNRPCWREGPHRKCGIYAA